MGGYPTPGYRNATARAKHSMSSADSSTRLAQRLDELTFIGPRDFRTPPKEKWRPLHKGTVDLNRGEYREVTDPGKRTVVLPARDPHVQHSSRDWRDEDRARIRTIDLSADEYRRIQQAGNAGRWGRAFRTAWKIARGVLRNKDFRLELALRILESVFPSLASDYREVGTGEYTLGPDWRQVTYAIWPDDGPPISPLNHYPGSAGNWNNFKLTGPQYDALLKTSGSHVGSSMFLSTAWYTPSGTTPPAYQANAGGQSGQNRNGTFTDRLGVWKRNRESSRNRHIASFVRPGGVSSPADFRELTTTALGRFMPAYQRPSTMPGFNRIGGNHPPTRTGAPEPWKNPVRQKDQKFAIALDGKSWTGRIVNGVTEAIDLIDITYDALGRKCKGANTPQAKLACIYRNWETINWGKFLAGVVENQIEDKAWGRLGQLSGQAARKVGRPTGFQTGPWDTEFSYHQRGLGFDVSFGW